MTYYLNLLLFKTINILHNIYLFISQFWLYNSIEFWGKKPEVRDINSGNEFFLIRIVWFNRNCKN